MKVICIYANRGEEYKATAELICKELIKAGHQAVVEELFDYLDIKWLDTFLSFTIKLFSKLRFKNQIKSSSRELDTLLKFAKKHGYRAFQSNLEEAPTDLFICIHPYTSQLITALRDKTNITDISVYYYETRFFSLSKRAVNNDLDKFFISTNKGKEEALSLGQKKETISFAPIISADIYTLNVNKVERKDNRIKILYDTKDDKINLSKLIRKDINADFLLINCSQEKFKKINAEASKCKNLKLYSSNNSNKFDLFSSVDIIIGPPDRKSMLIALYYNKAYFLTEKKKKTADIIDYLLANKLGLVLSNNSDKQAEEIKTYLKEYDPSRANNLNFNLEEFIQELSN